MAAELCFSLSGSEAHHTNDAVYGGFRDRTLAVSKSIDLTVDLRCPL